MNLIDTNGVSYVFQHGIRCDQIYYMAPEIIEETEMTEMIFDQEISKNIIDISQCGFFDERIYIDFYRQMLNKHQGRSFFNMTGFGDISILAAIHTIFKGARNLKQSRLFDLPDPIIVFTNDEGLVRRLRTEFPSENVQSNAIENIQ